MAFSISTVGMVEKSSNEENEEYVNEGIMILTCIFVNE